MNKALCACLAILAPALFAADPTVSFTATEIVVTVTPGASAAILTTSRGNSGLHSEGTLVSTDSDGDGIIRIARPTSSSLTRHAALAADLGTGAFAYATEGVAPSLGPIPPGTILRGPSGAFTQLSLPYTGMEIVWLRPGVGAWTASVDPFAGAGNVKGVYLADRTKFRITGGAPAIAAPEAFQHGDVLLVLDRGQQALAGTVNANLDDTSPGIVAFFDSIVGGTEGTGGTLKLWRLRNTSGAATVRLLRGGDAVEGVHYEPFDPVVRFAAGEMFKEFTIRTIDDQAWGDTVILTLQLGEPDNATLGAATTGSVTIYENDPTPSLGLEPAPADVIETDAPAVLTLTVTKQNATRLPATVRAKWTIARLGESVPQLTAQLTFAPGETQKTFDIPLPGTDVFEGTRTIRVELENAQSAVLRQDARSRTILLRDDELPRVTAAGSWVLEGFHQNMLAATLKALTSLDRPVTLQWRTVDGTARAGSDYTAMSGTVTNFDGEERIVMRTIQDEEIEGDEIFYIEIYAATGAEIVNGRTVVTIRDNSYPEVRIGSPTVVEGGPGARTNAVVRLSFSRPTVFPSVLSLVRSRELYSAPAAGSDYDGSWEGVPIYVPQGQSGVDVIIPILGDSEAEGNEELFLQTGLLLGFRGTQNGRLTIQEDDPGPPVTHVRVSGGGGAGTEEGPNRSALFSVSTFERKPGTLSVSWRTEDGTAIAGQDYVAAGGTLEFGANDFTKSFSVPLLDDAADENDETFSIVLHTPVNATMDGVRTTATIRDNDLPAAPPPRVEADDITAGEKDGAGTFTLRLSAAWPEPVLVQYATQPGLQIWESDYVPVTGSVTFAPGERTKTIAVPILDDPFYDPNDRIHLVLTSGMAVVPARAPVLAIDDDEPAPKRRSARH